MLLVGRLSRAETSGPKEGTAKAKDASYAFECTVLSLA